MRELRREGALVPTPSHLFITRKKTTLPRVYVNFERKGVVVERGAAAIEITRDATVEDVYKMALNKQFKEFLISDRQYDEDSMTWEFQIMKEDDTDGFTPYPPR